MTFFSRSPFAHIFYCILIAGTLLVPALLFQRFALAVVGVIVLGVAAILFSRPLYALLGYVMLIPFEELAVFDALGTPTRLAGILFFVAYLFHRRFQINVRVMPLAAWLWLAWVTLSLVWSPVLNWQYFFQTAQLFLATLLIADYVSRSPQKLNAILGSYTFSALIIALLGIYNFVAFSGNVSGFSFESRTSGIEGQGVETFAFSLIPAFLASFHYLINGKTQRQRWLAIFLLLVFATGMIVSGTRGAWVATLGALAVVYLPRLRPRQYLTLFITLALVVGFLSQIPVISEFVRYRAGDAVSSGGSGRVNIWLVSWQMYLQSPVLGIGWRMADRVMDIRHIELVPQNITWDDFRGFRPRVTHNIYLQTLLELGIIGFVIFMAWIIPLILTSLYQDKELRHLWLLCLAIFAAMLIGGMTNPEFHKKYYWLSLALLHGLRYAWLSHKNKPFL
jgi:O-antigen ligase